MEPGCDMTCSCEYEYATILSPTYASPATRKYLDHDSVHGTAEAWTYSFKNPSIRSDIHNNLSVKLLGDVGISAMVALCAAPWISVIDKAIVERSAGKRTMLQSSADSLKLMFREPISFLKSPMFRIMWGCYAATYATANGLNTLFEHYEQSYSMYSYAHHSVESNGGKTTMLLMTTIVNTTATILKDQYYTTAFGPKNHAFKTHQVPLFTYSLWGLRDSIIIGSAFLLPDIICDSLLQKGIIQDTFSVRPVLQVACPMCVPFIIGPIHLLSLDYYNRPLANMTLYQSLGQRISMMRRNYISVVTARIFRVSFGFAMGGVLNTYLRDQWRLGVEMEY